MSHFQKSLLTGAAGGVGSELRLSGTRLAKTVRLSDASPATTSPREEDFPLDLADFDAVSRAIDGCDAIVHMGGQAVEAAWQTILDSNISGGYHIYEAARRHGVKRIVYASSVHAIGYYERNETIDGTVPTRPDSLYGVSKTFVENLARYYFDKFGIETVSIRIGSCFPEPTDRRHLITWLSYRDCRQLVEKCLSAERTGFMVAYGMSDNSRAFWDNRAAASLGYKPEDSANCLCGKRSSRRRSRAIRTIPPCASRAASSANGHFEDT
ncbi:NAD-dependent epimerase/dehydratase family protein [Thauera sp. SDU_THAU2]|uniref:NAD-dependent epimerase/dehydratase family protein n=1 Tax=Thauera sp. SDU_THAU2 TaxID=3136633 RepID=UPI00311DC25D